MKNSLFNYPLTNTMLDKGDILAAIKVLKSKWITMGNETIKFEDCIGQNINFMMEGFWGGNADLVKEICEIGGQMYITEYINKKRVDNEQVIFGHIIKKYIKQIYLIRNTSRQEYINYYLFCNKVN